MDFSNKYRIITRSDFDGLASVVILRHAGLDIESILFVHPKDMQDNKIPVSDKDITINLPYVNGVYFAFDHHESERQRTGNKVNFVSDSKASSTARLIYNYYKEDYDLSGISKDMLEAVDKLDSANLRPSDILKPSGWILLGFIMDARTGLGHFKNFKISNYTLMMSLIDYCTKYSVDEILEIADVKERIDVYFKYENEYKNQINRISNIKENLLILDFRKEDIIYPSNRFMPYAMFLDVSVSMHILWGRDKKNVVCAMGKSIFKKTSEVNLANIASEYGGGGHIAAATCQLPIDIADEKIEEIVNKIISSR